MNKALTLFAGLVSELRIPGAGIAATCISNWAVEQRWRSIEQMLQRFKTTIENTPEAYSLDSLSSPEFQELLLRCLDVARGSTIDDKVRAAAGVLANALLVEGESEKVEYSHLYHYVHCIERMSVGAMQLLLVINDLAKPQTGYVGKVVDIAELSTDVLSESSVRNLVGELVAWGKTRFPQVSWSTFTESDSVPSTLVLTKEGRMFASFLQMYR